MQKMQKMYKGGVIFDELKKNGKTNSELFSEFVSNCRVAEVISDSSISGILIRLYGCPLFKSPYLSIRSNNEYEPITSCIFKFNIMSQNHGITYLTDLYPDRKSNYFNIFRNSQPIRFIRRKPDEDTLEGDLEIQSFETFMDEIKNTQKIYKESINPDKNNGLKLQPICPSIISYNSGIEPNNLEEFINIFKNKMIKQDDKDLLDRFKKLLNDLNKNSKKDIYKLVFNCQEMMEEYQTLNYYEKNNDNNFDSYLFLAKIQLIRLGMNLNILHNDAHMGNVMINPNLDFFHFSNQVKNIHIEKGYPIIIDFGRIKIINENSYKINYVGENDEERKIKYINNFYRIYPYPDISYNDYKTAMQNALELNESNIQKVAFKKLPTSDYINKRNRDHLYQDIKIPDIDELEYKITNLIPSYENGPNSSQNSSYNSISSTPPSFLVSPVIAKIPRSNRSIIGSGGSKKRVLVSSINYYPQNLKIKEFLKNIYKIQGGKTKKRNYKHTMKTNNYKLSRKVRINKKTKKNNKISTM